MSADELTFQRELGAKVRAARVAHHLTQEQLAGQLGITRASLANMEAGRQRISAYTLALASTTIGILITDLVPAVSPEGGSRKLRAKALRGLPEEHRTAIDQLIASAGHRGETDATTQTEQR